MDDLNLDDHIKRALENFQEPFQEGHWELMEQRLNDSANSDLSERLDDHIIREKLSQLNPTVHPEHWEVMAAKLAALSTQPIIDDALVDGVAYENLSELNPPYEEAHWDLMEKKIEEELYWKNKVVRYKLMELSLVVLFLFTFVQYWPNAKEIIQNLPINQERHIINGSDQDEVTIEHQTPIAQNTTTSLLKDDASINNVETTAIDVEVNSNVNTFAPRPIQNEQINSLSTPTVLRSVDAVQQIKKLDQPIAVSNLAEKEKAREDDYRNAAYILASFDMLANVEESLLDQPEFSIPDCGDCLKAKSKSYLRIGTKGIGTVDFYNQHENGRANLNEQKDFEDLTKLRSYEFGYGAGLTVGVRKDRWEYETGFSYSTKQTNPETIFVIADESLLSGISGTAWVGSNLDLLQIPIHIRYDFLNKKKWKMYGQSGMTLNIALNSIDRYQDIVVREPQNYRADSGGDAENEKTELIAVTNNEGVSKGGSFAQNSFFTLDAGLGLERQISARYSAFFYSSYHQTLGFNGLNNTGFGLGTLSFQTGFKFSFVKKSSSNRQNIQSHTSQAGNILTR